MKLHLTKLVWCTLCLSLLAVVGCPRPDTLQDSSSRNKQQPRVALQEPVQSASQSNLALEPVSHATFIFTADFQGFQRPCGCATAQHGGLLRIGAIMNTVGDALLKQDTVELADFGVSVPDGLSGEHSLWLVDCGNFADSKRRLPGLRVQGHLEALAHTGAVAAVVNRGELRLSEAQAVVAFSDPALPVTSCNVVSNIPGITFEKYVKLAANWYLIGLSANAGGGLSEGQGGWWTLHDPLQSVQDVIAGLPQGANVVISAAHQPRNVVDELAKLDVRAIIGDAAITRQGEKKPGAPRVQVPASRGAKLQLLSFDEAFEQGYQPWFIITGEEWPDDPGVANLIKDQQTELKKQLALVLAAQYGPGGYDNISWGMDNKYLPPAKSDEELAGQHYLGSKACQVCHAAEYKIWESSGHAEAWESLVEVSEQDTLDCLQCHTTGMFERGGYSPFAHNDSLVSVGCEACHGPGFEHGEWAQAGADNATPAAIDKGSTEGCFSCHDTYNSPEFEADSYWEAIAH